MVFMPLLYVLQEKIAARRSVPVHSSEPSSDPLSPRSSAKGVAMIVELYNKNKGDLALPDVDEQTLTAVDDSMFRRRSGKQPDRY